jgi:hypothetical protein
MDVHILEALQFPDGRLSFKAQANDTVEEHQFPPPPEGTSADDWTERCKNELLLLLTANTAASAPPEPITLPLSGKSFRVEEGAAADLAAADRIAPLS